jgi:hypothetical protein
MTEPIPPPSLSSGGGTGDSTVSATPVLNDGQKLDQWLNHQYLRYTLEDDSEISLTMQDFIDLTVLTHPRCLLNGEHMSLALALSVKKNKRADTVLLSEFSAQSLYHFGNGPSEELEDLPGIVRSILDDKKRWIVVPCSDGVLHAEEIEKGYKKNVRGRTDSPDHAGGELEDRISNKAIPDTRGVSKATARVPEPRSTEHGSHWGILIVDKQEKVAHWVDSLVTLRPNFKIAHMFRAARVAGKVLCGIDSVLSTQENFEKGTFDARTLKYVPQQGSHNSTRGDHGACGPFMFAFLEHVFRYPKKLNSLRASFPRSGMNKINFHSLMARREIRGLIMQEVESRDNMPFHLTQDLLHAFSLVPVDHLVRTVEALQGRPPLPPRSTKSNKGRNNNKDNDDDDDDNNPDYAPYREDYLRSQKEGKLADFNITALAQYVEHVQVENIQLAKATVDTTAKEKELEVRINETSYRIPRNDIKVFKPYSKDHKGKPRGVTDNLPEFAQMSRRTTNQWVGYRSNKEIADHQKVNEDHNLTTSKAMLHIKFKHTFLTESDDDIRDEWVHDTMVFTPDQAKSDLEVSRIRHMLMTYYETATLKHIEKYAVRKRKNDEEHGGSDPKKAKTKEKSHWVTCSDEDVKNAMTDEIMKNPRARNSKDLMVYRAIFFAHDGSKFADEEEETCLSFWINDPLVFKEGRDYTVEDGKRAATISVADIKRRMGLQYEYEVVELEDDDGAWEDESL